MPRIYTYCIPQRDVLDALEDTHKPADLQDIFAKNNENRIKEEPRDEKGECESGTGHGVSESAREQLYADHLVKDEVVVGPEVLQPRDSVYVTSGDGLSVDCQSDGLSIYSQSDGLSIDCQSVKSESSGDPDLDSPSGLEECILRLKRVVNKALLTQSKPKHDSTKLASSSLAHRDWKAYDCVVRVERLHTPHVCPTCLKIFVDRRGLENHPCCRKGDSNVNGTSNVYQVTPDAYNPLTLATRDCVVKLELDSTVVKSLTCYSCSKTFANDASLVNHLPCPFKDECDGNKSDKIEQNCYICDTCGMEFKVKAGIVCHVRKHARNLCCEMCSKCFTLKSKLKKHLLLHLHQQPHSCKICHKIFKSKSFLDSHELTHNRRKSFVCDACGKHFTQRYLLITHILEHDEKRYSCEVCQKQYKTESSLAAHKYSVHIQDRPFSCEICGVTFTLERFLIKHKGKHDGKTVPCSVCNKRIKGKYNLEEHLRTHTKEKPFECNICNKKFRQRNSFKRHHRTHTGEKPFSCETCGRKFAHKNTLLGHQLTHTQVKKLFICDICGKRYRNNYLSKHMEIHAKENVANTEQKLFICDFCGKRYSRKSHLRRHMKTHSKDLFPYSCDKCNKLYLLKKALIKHMQKQCLFPCDVCGKQFRSRSELACHSGVHTGVKAFPCEICNKYYRTKSILNQHLGIHTAEKPFSCDVCGKQFRAKTTLKVHTRIHTGEKQFSCGICHKKFTHRHSLLGHQLVHTGQKSFICDLCGRRFALKSYLTRHLRWHSVTEKKRNET